MSRLRTFFYYKNRFSIIIYYLYIIYFSTKFFPTKWNKITGPSSKFFPMFWNKITLGNSFPPE